MQIKKFGELFGSSWEAYQAKLKVLATLMVIPFVANVIYILSLHKTTVIDHGATRIIYESGPISLVIGLVFFILTLWVQVALIKAVDAKADNPDPASLLSKSTNLILPLLLVSVLTFLAVLGGLVLLIVPGVIFAIWFSFSTYALILDDKRGTEALSVSKELVVGRWSTVFWRIIAIGLALVGISIIASIVFSIFPYKIHAILSSVVSSFMLTPLATIYIYLLYKELKHHKAGHAADKS